MLVRADCKLANIDGATLNTARQFPNQQICANMPFCHLTGAAALSLCGEGPIPAHDVAPEYSCALAVQQATLQS